MVKEDSDENMTSKQMALFIRKFNKVMKKSGFLNNNKDKDKIIQKTMLWVWQGGSLHCGVPQHQGEKKGHQQVRQEQEQKEGS
jgi:hypothetical protein